MDNLITSSKTASDRLGLKLGALFILVFGGLVIGLLAWDVFSTMSRREDNLVRPEEVTVIDPRLEADLKKVLELTGIPENVEARDAFRDRADLSGEMAKMDRGPVTGGGSTGIPGSPGSSGGPATGEGAGGGAKPAEAPDPVAETKARFDRRQERVRLGLNAGPESEVFAVDDLLPVGVVGGGSGTQEVLVYSLALKRTFSFPVGTKLFDGWIGEVRAEGVAFVMDGKVRTSRVKPWSSSIKDASDNRPATGRFLNGGRVTELA